jgi:putative oxidoreductase
VPAGWLVIAVLRRRNGWPGEAARPDGLPAVGFVMRCPQPRAARPLDRAGTLSNFAAASVLTRFGGGVAGKETTMTTTTPEQGGSAEARPIIPALAPFYANFARDISYPLIRATVGGTMLVHGIDKLMGPPIATFAQSLAKSGIEPAWLFAYIVYINETVGAVCIILGLFTRLFAASIAIELAVISIQFFHNGYAWSRHGWEYVFLWGLIFFAIALRGGGPYSLDRKIGWEL